MKDFWPGRVDRNIRWLPRILGTLIGLFALGEFVEGLGYLGQLDTSGIMIRIGLFLVFAGCAVAWFKELAGSLLILGGTAIFCVIPGGPPASVFMLPAVVGFLYLFVHIGTKRKESRK